LDFLLYTIHFPSGQKLPVRQGLQPIVIPTNSDESLHMAIPRSHILVSNRPVHSKAVSAWAFKIVLTPTLCLPCPNQGFPPYLIAPDPIKWLLLDVGMISVLHEEMLRVFLKSIAPVDHWIFKLFRQWNFISVRSEERRVGKVSLSRG